MNQPTFNKSDLERCGNDVKISGLVSITRPELISIGDHVAIDPWFHCTTTLKTGNFVHISSNVSIIGGKTGLLTLGHFTNISAGGVVVCVSEKFHGAGLIGAPGIPAELLDERRSGPVTFEDFVNIGANVTILPGVTLKEGCVIGACSLVTRDTEPWTIYAGTPAKPFGKRERTNILDAAKKLGYPFEAR